MSKPRGEGPLLPFSIAPQVLPEGPFKIMPVLGHPSREESYPVVHPRAKQGDVKGGRGSAPAREISFVSLVAYGPKVYLLSLSHGGLQLLKPGRVVPNTQWSDSLSTKTSGAANQ